MNLKAVLIIISLLYLTACQKTSDIIKADIKVNDDIAVSPTAAEVYPGESLNIYYSLSNYEPKKFEPNNGCYIGAYILADRSIGFDISQFELKTSRHSSYKYHLKLGEEFPASWILSCNKDSKLPFIILSAENNEMPFNYSLVTEYAKKFGELNEPVLIGFYPEPVKNGYPAEIYKKFFEYAKSEFDIYAPNTAIAFITNSEEVYKIDDYFPQSQSVDWVGIDIYMPIENDRLKNSSLSSLNYFYNKYQSKYPLMVSALGISNYSADNHTYYTKEAAEEITNFYSIIENKYPRIKAVYYMDFDSSSLLESENTNPNSFLITNDDNVTLSYKKAIQNLYFKDTFSVEQSSWRPQKILSSSLAVVKNGDFYIPRSLAESLGFLTDISSLTQIDGKAYDKLSILSEINSLSVNKENSSIYISS